MSASGEAAIGNALALALNAREVMVDAREHERLRTVQFIDEARHQSWDWNRIGTVLGVSGTAARRYYERNRRHVRAA